MASTPAETMTVVPQFPGDFLALTIYTAVAALLIGVLLLAAWWLGAKSTSTNKGIAYESGVIPTGSARLAYPVPFYLVAIFFIVVLLLGLVWLWLKGGLEWGPSAEGRSSAYKKP